MIFRKHFYCDKPTVLVYCSKWPECGQEAFILRIEGPWEERHWGRTVVRIEDKGSAEPRAKKGVFFF